MNSATHPQLKRLKIHRYEEFVDVPWIEFSPHENVILGINGAGKTRLLRLLSAVLNFNYEPLLNQDFDIEFDLAYFSHEVLDSVVVQMHGHVFSMEIPADPSARGMESQTSQRDLVVELDASAGDHRLSYRSNSDGTSLSFDDVSTTVARIPPAGTVIPWDHIAGMKEPAYALWPGYHGLYVGEDAREFDALTTAVSFQLRPNKPRRGPVLNDPGGLPRLLIATLVEQFAALAKPREGLRFGSTDAFPKVPDEGEPPAQFLPLLASIGAEYLTLTPKILQTTADMLECRGIEVRVHFNSGVEIVDAGLTFGQRRFLMMALQFLFRPSYPAFVDEIDNGLHPRLIEAVLNMLSGCQSFFTSHNKIVVDYINYDSADDIRRKIHICRRDVSGRQTVIALSEAVAQEVYEKIEVGIMHPSDVLLMEGLW